LENKQKFKSKSDVKRVYKRIELNTGFNSDLTRLNPTIHQSLEHKNKLDSISSFPTPSKSNKSAQKSNLGCSLFSQKLDKIEKTKSP